MSNEKFLKQALAIQQDMKEPQHFTRKCGVLNWGMGTLIFMHVIIGIVGYAKYGSSVTGNFVQNHLRLDTVTAIALGVQALGIFFSYGIQCFLPISILHKDYAVRSIQDGCLKGTPYFWNIMIRIAVTLLTCKLNFKKLIFSIFLPRKIFFQIIDSEILVLDEIPRKMSTNKPIL